MALEFVLFAIFSCRSSVAEADDSGSDRRKAVDRRPVRMDGAKSGARAGPAGALGSDLLGAAKRLYRMHSSWHHAGLQSLEAKFHNISVACTAC